MNPNGTQFKLIISRIRSGELTRAQAAEEYKINLGTLNVWISRAKLGPTLPSLRGKVGTAGEMAEKDPDKVAAMEAAVARVFAGEISALAMSKEDPRVNHRTLADKVRRAKQKAGEKVQKRAKRKAPPTTP